MELTEQQQQSICYPHPKNATHDLNYSNPDITDVVLSFLESIKMKKNHEGVESGKYMSHSHVRKHHDAVLHCSTFVSAFQFAIMR